MNRWACVAALLAAGASARADFVTFSGTFGAIEAGSPTTSVTSSLAGGSFSGSIDVGPLPIAPLGQAIASDYSITLKDSSGAVAYSSSGPSGPAGWGGVVAGVGTTQFAGSGGAFAGTSLFVDVFAGVPGHSTNLILVFDSRLGGDGDTASLVPSSPGSPPALSDQFGGSVSYLAIATATTTLPISQVTPSGPSAPEPASLALLGLGAPALAWRCRRRRPS